MLFRSDWPMKVVFYTCYDKYMLDAIRSSAFDYLLKPFESDDLDAIISRFYTEMKDDNLEDKLSQVATINGGEKLFAIATPTDDIRVLRASDIGYFRYNSERKLWEVILRNNHSPLLLKRNTNAETIKHFDKCFGGFDARDLTHQHLVRQHFAHVLCRNDGDH